MHVPSFLLNVGCNNTAHVTVICICSQEWVVEIHRKILSQVISIFLSREQVNWISCFDLTKGSPTQTDERYVVEVISQLTETCIVPPTLKLCFHVEFPDKDALKAMPSSNEPFLLIIFFFCLTLVHSTNATGCLQQNEFFFCAVKKCSFVTCFTRRAKQWMANYFCKMSKSFLNRSTNCRRRSRQEQ